MKKNILITSIILFFLYGCLSLKETPESFVTTENFYKTQNDAIAAVTAVYYELNAGGSSVQTPYNTLFSTGMEFMTDDEDPGPGATNPDVRSQAVLGQSSSGLRILQIWQQHYSAIAKANLAIDKIPGISFDPILRNRLVAEAKFLRALYYFNLVRLYGDVPLVTAGTTTLNLASLQIPRTPAAIVYNQIIQDLDSAYIHLPNSYGGPDLGRATAGAAKSLLAKVYLTQRNWANAYTTASQVITGPYGYGLITPYSHVFLPQYKNGIEHIFSAQFKTLSLGQGNENANRAAPKLLATVLNGIYADQVRFYKDPVSGNPNFSIYKLYRSNDQRKSTTLQTVFTGADGKQYFTLNYSTVNGVAFHDTIPYWNKYFDPGTITNLVESAANVPIIRLAEVLLIKAEADNELNNGPTGEGYAAINQVRARAGLNPLTAGLDVNSFRDSVYLERRLELAYEYQRWFDLIREKDANGNGILERNLKLVGKTNVQPKHYLYPVPQQEINLNPKLTQNPGW